MNTNPMDEDLQLLDRHAAGDREAFNDLVRKYQRPLYALLYRMVSDADDAADLLQKTLVKAFTGIGGFERRASFKTWLYQIAINLAKNLYRDRSRMTRLSLDDIVIPRDPRTLEILMRKETRKRLHGAFADLPDKQRLTVLLRVQDHRTYEEIASIMGCTTGTAKANYHHGVQKLKKALAETAVRNTAPAPEGEPNHVL
jgi:RNA polymerase sigma-70 factor (ECF subfamily)